MATSHLVYINYQLAELAKAEEDFSTLDTAGWQAKYPVAPLEKWSRTGDVSALELKDLTDKIQRLNAEAGAVEKARCYLADGRVARMVNMVKSMVEGLFLQFSPPRDDLTALLARNRVLLQRGQSSPAPSDNGAFCAEDEPQVSLSEPYLYAFEYGRLVIAPLDTEPLAGDAGNNLYRRPDVQGLPEDSRGTERPEFESAHDVYALGMVLLELGSHRSLQSLKEKSEKSSGQRWSAQPFRDWVVTEGLEALLPRIGEIHTDVVRVCLKGLKRDNGYSFQETFFNKVVKMIDLCIA
ncbi:hypothetical protein B0J13DRAFT_528893 [Dactylonectria estremocensis]|uniref:Protein kinase domain-containing protein n=1 Tax=Dactylonectria estremocensis TaxID=1079267 RepID=A0A9P9EDZ0_9HYPO|nr:hypothetical protein B0J13DRAFT_528893 [Dactylonectria estremocensis]